MISTPDSEVLRQKLAKADFIFILIDTYPLGDNPMFKANVGEKESLMRLIAGAVLIALAMLAGGLLQWIIMIAGVVMVATGIVRWCPAYHAMKKSTANDG